MARKAKIVRKTTETDIRLEIDLDKTAGSSIETTIPFLITCWSCLRHSVFETDRQKQGGHAY